MTERTDEQVLAQEMGLEWHEPYVIKEWNYYTKDGVEHWTTRRPFGDMRDPYEREVKPRNPDFTSGDILWRVLQYMMGREDWEGFFWWAYKQSDQIGPYRLQLKESHYIKWLLSTDSTGCRLVRLAAQWVREKGGIQNG